MCELTLDAAGLDQYGQPKQPLPARFGIIIDCNTDEFLFGRERSFTEINNERRANWQRRWHARESILNDRKARRMSGEVA